MTYTCHGHSFKVTFFQTRSIKSWKCQKLQRSGRHEKINRVKFIKKKKNVEKQYFPCHRTGFKRLLHVSVRFDGLKFCCRRRHVLASALETAKISPTRTYYNYHYYYRYAVCSSRSVRRHENERRKEDEPSAARFYRIGRAAAAEVGDGQRKIRPTSRPPRRRGSLVCRRTVRDNICRYRKRINDDDDDGFN